MGNKSRKTIFLVLIALHTSCMTSRVVATYDSSIPTSEKITRWNLFWGLKQQKDVITNQKDCKTICLFESRTNLGFILISALSLGIVVPVELEYECCPYIPKVEEIK